MQTDVLASVPLTTTGQFTAQNTNNIGRCRIKSIYVVPSGTAGSLVIKDGGSSGDVLATINTVASATQPTYLLIPGQGLLVESSPYGVVTSLGSATIFYG
jgi:hypothetical protein